MKCIVCQMACQIKLKQVLIEKGIVDLGLKASSIAKKPTVAMTKVAPARIALWDTYGGSMPSGWVRWMLEQYHYNFDLIYPKGIDAGDVVRTALLVGRPNIN